MVLDPVQIFFAVIGSILGLVALLGATSRDSRFGRRRVARRMFDASEKVRSKGAADEDVRRARYLLKHTALFGHRFGSCYAITLLGDLAVESTADPYPDAELIGVIAECLDREDPFVRHAAAASLYRVRPRATYVLNRLARTAERFPNESSGELAKRTVRGMEAGV